jgi:hypothetical protein
MLNNSRDGDVVEDARMNHNSNICSHCMLEKANPE